MRLPVSGVKAGEIDMRLARFHQEHDKTHDPTPQAFDPDQQVNPVG